MRFATMWWGVQILADTDDDEKLLSALLEALPEKAECSYDEGTLRKIKPTDADSVFGFDKHYIANNKLVIEFTR